MNDYNNIDFQKLLLIYPNLKRQSPAGINFLKPWNQENMIDGFRKFFDDTGRYPTAEEIDDYEFLPSSRQIQRAFGGLVNLRKELGLKIDDYSRGENRSKIGFEVNKIGGLAEKEMEEELISHFGEYFVHVEKPLYKYIKPESKLRKDSKCRVDFLVYAQNYLFCVDVFHTKTMRTFVGNVNAKSKKYNEMGSITNEKIEHYVANKTSKLDPNIRIVNKTSFYEMIKKLPVLKVN
jgi:hypothetical protein